MSDDKTRQNKAILVCDTCEFELELWASDDKVLRDIAERHALNGDCPACGKEFQRTPIYERVKAKQVKEQVESDPATDPLAELIKAVRVLTRIGDLRIEQAVEGKVKVCLDRVEQRALNTQMYTTPFQVGSLPTAVAGLLDKLYRADKLRKQTHIETKEGSIPEQKYVEIILVKGDA